MEPKKAFWLLAGATFFDRWAWSAFRAVLIFFLISFSADGEVTPLFTKQDAEQWTSWIIGSVYLVALMVSFGITSLSAERNAVKAGPLFFCLGYLGLFLADSEWGIISSIGAILLGRSLVVNALPVLVGRVNERSMVNDQGSDPIDRAVNEQSEPKSLDAWMTRLYMAGNAGSCIGPLVAGLLYGWRDVFLVCTGISLAAGVTTMYFCAHWSGKERSATQVLGAGSPELSSGFFQVMAILAITVFSVIFWSGFEQKALLLNVFATNSVDLWVWKPAWFQSIGPFLIVALAPGFDYLWRKLDSRRLNQPVNPFHKLAAGLWFLGLGFGILPSLAGADGRVSWAVLFLVYVCHTIGELLLEPIGQSLVLRLAPPRWKVVLLSIWNVSTTGACVLAGYYGIWWGATGAAVPSQYAPLWHGLGLLAGLSGLLLFLISGILMSWCRAFLGSNPQPAAT